MNVQLIQIVSDIEILVDEIQNTEIDIDIEYVIEQLLLIAAKIDAIRRQWYEPYEDVQEYYKDEP